MVERYGLATGPGATGARTNLLLSLRRDDSCILLTLFRLLPPAPDPPYLLRPKEKGVEKVLKDSKKHA